MEEQYRSYFKKLQTLNSLTDYCLDIASKNGLDTLPDTVDLTCGALPEGDYDEVIDQDNPKMFLELYTGMVESRLALTVTECVKVNFDFLPVFCNLFKEAGKTLREGIPQNCLKAYVLLDSLLPDGIPDGIPGSSNKSMVYSVNNKVIWEIKDEIHGQYWEKFGGDPDFYYELTASFAEGILEGSDIKYSSQRNVSFMLEKTV